MRTAVLRFFAWLVGYRFNECLGETLSVPSYYKDLDIEKIRGKATASLAAAGILLGFSIAVLAAVMASKEYRDAIVRSWQHSWRVSGSGFALVILLWLVIRQERILSRPGERTFRYFVLMLFFVLSILVFIAAPLGFRSEEGCLGSFVSRPMLEFALPLSGFLALLTSTLFEVFALEFYDSAAGWRGGDKNAGMHLRFHLAGLASHSFLFGLSFALLGTCLLLSGIHFWVGSVTTVIALTVLVAMTEIERELWARKE